MGREVRRVPPNWEHPIDDRGEFIPLHDQSFKEAAAEWKAEFAKWEAGERPEYMLDKHSDDEFWEYFGDPPDRDSYRPEFTEPAIWWQGYETVSEGTPFTPAFATKEELVQYLMHKGGLHRDEYPSLFPLLTREQAERFVECGSAPSMVVSGGVIRQGIESV